MSQPHRHSFVISTLSVGEETDVQDSIFSHRYGDQGYGGKTDKLALGLRQHFMEKGGVCVGEPKEACLLQEGALSHLTISPCVLHIIKSLESK